MSLERFLNNKVTGLNILENYIPNELIDEYAEYKTMYLIDSYNKNNGNTMDMWIAYNNLYNLVERAYLIL